MSKSLFRSTTVVSGITALSRILGFLRDMLVAQLFGATPAIDAFYVAFRIPNFMRGLFAEGAFAQAFVPVLSEYRQLRSIDEAKQFICRMQGILAFILCCITVLAMLFTPWLTTLFAPGFVKDPQRFELTTHMLRITFPYLFLISMTAFYASVLNAYGTFGAASFTPVLLNLMMILAALCLSPHFAQPVVGLAWGVVLAGVMQFLFLMPFLSYRKLLLIPSLVWRDPGVRKVTKLLVPALFGVSVAQISLLLDTLFASFLPTGSITWLYYSDRLVYFPLGIFGVALATVILPHLSRKYVAQSSKEFSSAMDWALRSVLVIAIPSSIGLYMLATPLFAALFQYGKFHAHDVEMASLSLRAYALGLPAFMLVKVLASGFYARQDIKTPVRVAIAALLVNMLLNVTLIWHFKHQGLALATALASIVNAGLLCWYLISRGDYQLQSGWGRYLLQLCTAGVAVVGLLAWWSPPAAVWIDWVWQQRILHLLGLLVAAMAVYFVCLYAVGIRLRDFRERS
jgi:putative peptidoglycan lipid II flippase